MPVQDVLARIFWEVNADLPLGFTTYAGSILCFLSATFLFVIAKALGPDMRTFPCASTWFRGVAGFTAFAWGVRGIMLYTSANPANPDFRNAHWDLPFSWGCTTALSLSAMVLVLRLKRAPGWWARFEETAAKRMRRSRELEAQGHIGRTLSLLEAGGFTVAAPGEGPEALVRPDL